MEKKCPPKQILHIKGGWIGTQLAIFRDIHRRCIFPVGFFGATKQKMGGFCSWLSMSLPEDFGKMFWGQKGSLPEVFCQKMTKILKQPIKANLILEPKSHLLARSIKQW